MAINSEGVEQSCASEQCMVTSREDTSDDDSVNEAAGNTAACLLENDGKGGGPGVLGGQFGIVVWHIQANHEDGQDIEDEDSPEDIANHLRHVARGVLRLSGSDGNGLRSAAGQPVSICEAKEKQRRQRYMIDRDYQCNCKDLLCE